MMAEILMGLGSAVVGLALGGLAVRRQRRMLLAAEAAHLHWKASAERWEARSRAAEREWTQQQQRANAAVSELIDAQRVIGALAYVHGGRIEIGMETYDTARQMGPVVRDPHRADCIAYRLAGYRGPS